MMPTRTNCFIWGLALLLFGGIYPSPADAQLSFVQRNGTENPFNGFTFGMESVPALVDLDADGDLDVLVGSSDGPVAYLENTGGPLDPQFVRRTGSSNPLSGIELAYGRLTATDVERDGDLDLIAGRGQGTTFIENVGSPSNPSFIIPTRQPRLGGVSGAAAPGSGDLTGDKGDDIIIGSSPGAFDYWENTSSSSQRSFVSNVESPVQADPGPLNSPAVGDLDGDQDADVVSGNLFGALRFLVNTDTTDSVVLHPASENPFASLALGAGATPSLGDLNGDGALDLVVGSIDGTLRYIEQTPATSVSRSVASDQTIDFIGTGMIITFSGTSGSGTVTVQKFNAGPQRPKGIGEQNISTNRYVVTKDSSLDFGGDTEIRLDVSTIEGILRPSDVSIYQRPQPGQGAFTKLTSTRYDPDAGEFVAEVSGFSEFVLASNTNPLPVEITRFDGQLDRGAVRLTWQTASETENAGFRVQRKMTGTPWTQVAFVNGHGTTSQSQSYQFTDADLPYEAGRLAYRLEQVDTDGTTTLSEEITIRREPVQAELMSPFPNPTDEQVTIRYAVPQQTDVTVRLYDVLGRQVQTIVNGPQVGRVETRLDVSELPSGTYFVRMRADTFAATRRLTVIR